MIHVCLYLAQVLLWRGRKCTDISLSNAVAISAMLSSSWLFPLGPFVFVFRLSSTSSLDPRGIWDMTKMTLYVVGISSGASKKPKMYHRHTPDARWNLETFGTNFWRASTFNMVNLWYNANTSPWFLPHASAAMILYPFDPPCRRRR